MIAMAGGAIIATTAVAAASTGLTGAAIILRRRPGKIDELEARALLALARLDEWAGR